MALITSQNMPGYLWDPSAGSNFESGMSGGAALGGGIATAFGTGGITGVVDMQTTTDAHGNQVQTRTYDGRALATATLTVMAGAATGAAALSQVAGPGGAVAGTALGMIATGLNGYFAHSDSQKCVAKLELIKTKMPAGGGADPDLQVISETIDYCLHQQQKKSRKGLANATIVGQPLKIVNNFGRAAYKFQQGTKGVDRRKYAGLITAIAQKNGGLAPMLARAVIQALMAQNYDEIMTNTVANAMKSG